jgi:hypothetical protein
MKSRGILLPAVPVLLWPGTIFCGTASNVVFILADDLEFGDAGCFERGKDCTRHLARRPAEGLRLA